MNELDRCPRCDEPYEAVQEGDQLKGKCSGCGLSAIVTSIAALISPYTPKDVLHYEMTKKAEMENAK